MRFRLIAWCLGLEDKSPKPLSTMFAPSAERMRAFLLSRIGACRRASLLAN